MGKICLTRFIHKDLHAALLRSNTCCVLQLETMASPRGTKYANSRKASGSSFLQQKSRVRDDERLCRRKLRLWYKSHEICLCFLSAFRSNPAYLSAVGDLLLSRVRVKGGPG